MNEININIKSEEKSRVLYRKSCSECAELLKGYGAKFIICDRNVYDSIGKHVANSFREQKLEGWNDENIYLIDATEKNKNIETVLKICSWLLEKNADRNAILIGIGGGITTDMTGFAASIYKRGIKLGFIPTTLLAQVDAAIGGKNGVNFEDYKNILGVTRQPEFTLICSDSINTLSYRDFLSGAAEMLKSFIIRDEGNYDKCVNILSQIVQAEDKAEATRMLKDELAEMIYEAAKVKAAIVEKDPFEKDERRKLNLGHTFAHAIEHFARIDGLDITHGEAVSMGIVLAAKLSELTGCSATDKGDSLSAKIKKDFESCGLPVDCPFNAEKLSDAIGKDKKAVGNEVNFVLIRKIGELEIKRLKPESIKIIDK
ncbi:MAG: 3-dehydroquinate synthase family protein [Candidatus Cryptobacteroides sp.]